MHQKQLRKRIVVILLSLVLLLHSAAAWATLQNEMQSMFNTMTNITDGGYHKGMGRGVVAGPSVVMRNNRVRTDLINFVPPSLNAGCGGIDMFLGSFSFIDADQFVNLMQAVATNAAGYAFKLALETMCPTCAQTITSLQRMMQKLNAMAGDSCRIAEAGVDYLADQLGTAELSKKIEQGPIAGYVKAVGHKADEFSAYLDTLGTGSNTRTASEAEINALLGNIAWKVLLRNNYVGSAFGSGDHEMAEALMSVTGTVIGVKGSGDSPEITLWENILTVKDILQGATPNVGAKPKRYHCVDSDCLTLTQVDYEFKGLERLVKEVILGSNMDIGADSFVFKLCYNSGALTDMEKQLIRVAPYHMTRLRNIAVCAGQGNLGSTEKYAKKAARSIALEVLSRYLKDAMASIMQITQGSGQVIGGVSTSEALVPKYRAIMQKVNADLREEQAQLEATLTTDLEQIYQSAVANCNLRPAHIVNPVSGK